MCMYMCVYLCVCVFVCIYMCVYVCVCICMYMCVYICVYIYVYMYMYICECIYMYICICVYIYKHYRLYYFLQTPNRKGPTLYSYFCWLLLCPCRINPFLLQTQLQDKTVTCFSFFSQYFDDYIKSMLCNFKKML